MLRHWCWKFKETKSSVENSFYVLSIFFGSFFFVRIYPRLAEFPLIVIKFFIHFYFDIILFSHLNLSGF